jgi:hypothetical protein
MSTLRVNYVLANGVNITLIIRVIRKVRKRQHQYPEFGHKQGEIQKKPAKNVH